MARDTATVAASLYLQLAKEIRGIASLFVDKMKGSIGDVEFAERMAKASANLHDVPRELFSITAGVPHVLIDPKPDYFKSNEPLTYYKKRTR